MIRKQNFHYIVGGVAIFVFILGIAPAILKEAEFFLLETPDYIKIFLFLNIGLHTITGILINEVEKTSTSEIWKNLRTGNYVSFVLTLYIILILLHLLNETILVYFIIISYLVAHSMVSVTIYLLIKPLLKKKVKFISLNHASAFIITISFWFFAIAYIIPLDYPVFNTPSLVYMFILILLGINYYFVYVAIHISEGYKKIGFVRKPYFAAAIGLFSAIIYNILIIYYIFEDLNILYYHLVFYSFGLIFMLAYYLRFAVEYPSLLQPRWKAFMPFDLPRAAFTFFLVFFATSMYFTARDMGFTADIPFFVYPGGVSLFLPLAALFTYSKAFALKTTLRYWTYLKTEMSAHLFLTFYVLSTGLILWNTLSNEIKILYILLYIFSFTFYLTAALDIRKLTHELRITTGYDKFNILRYGLSFISLFFIIFFSVLITAGRQTYLDTILARYSYYPLFLIGAFLVFYYVYLRYTHRGFEELMEKGLFTSLSYVAGLLIFITFYLIYTQTRAPSSSFQFPYMGGVFFGYFIVLIADVYSINTLRIKEYEKEGRKDIIHLLNSVAGYFFRTDVLEKLWEDVIRRYKEIAPEIGKARFYAPDRIFEIEFLHEREKNTVAVAMLLEMEKIVRQDKTVALSFEVDIKKEIESALNEKVLLLPDDLSKNFSPEQQHTKLLNNTFNRLISSVKPFVSLEDYSSVYNKLSQVDPFFEKLSYDEDGTKIDEDVEISREEFLEYLKIYIKAVEEIFPFNRLLLRDALRLEVDQRLSLYGFTQGDILDIVPTGAAELDNVLYGGVIKGTSTLFLSDEQRAKDDLQFLFAGAGLKEGGHVIFATSRRDTADIEKDLKRFAGSTKNLVLIDLFRSIHTDMPVDKGSVRDSRRIIPASLIRFRTEIVSTVKGLPKRAHKRIVLDVYNDLSKYQKNEDIEDLMIKQAAGFKKWNCTSIITIPPSLSSDELEKHFDNVFRLVDTSTFEIKKLFGGKPKQAVFTLWESYSPIESPGYSLFLERQ